MKLLLVRNAVSTCMTLMGSVLISLSPRALGLNRHSRLHIHPVSVSVAWHLKLVREIALEVS